MDQLCQAKLGGPNTRAVTLSKELGIGTTRVIQFLNLMRIPADLRVQLLDKTDITEHRLRAIVQMDPAAMRAEVRRVLGVAGVAKAG